MSCYVVFMLCLCYVYVMFMSCLFHVNVMFMLCLCYVNVMFMLCWYYVYVTPFIKAVPGRFYIYIINKHHCPGHLQPPLHHLFFGGDVYIMFILCISYVYIIFMSFCDDVMVELISPTSYKLSPGCSTSILSINTIARVTFNYLFISWLCYVYVMLCHVYLMFMLCLCDVHVMFMLYKCYIYIMFMSPSLYKLSPGRSTSILSINTIARVTFNFVFVSSWESWVSYGSEKPSKWGCLQF